MTQKNIEKHNAISNGFPYNSSVVYGDTDSVMITFGPESDNIPMKLALKYGLEAAQQVTDKLFKKPIMLDYVSIKSDTNKALEYTKNIISKLLQNKIDLSSLNSCTC